MKLVQDINIVSVKATRKGIRHNQKPRMSRGQECCYATALSRERSNSLAPRGTKSAEG